MFDSPKELLEKIRRGESTFLEYKEVRFTGNRVTSPHRDSLANSLAAFANAEGGVFILGIEDKTHEIVGIPVEHLDTVANFVGEVCADSIKPPIEDFVLDSLLLPSSLGEELAVIKVDIRKSLFVHESPGGYMRRVGNSKRSMSYEYLLRLSQQRSQTRIIRFDEQIVTGAKLDDLSFPLRERFRNPLSNSDQEVFLRKLGMLRMDEEGMAKPTVAGMLMASEEPRKWLPNAFIQAVAYKGDQVEIGEERIYQLDAADISGPLDHQIVDACRFVAKNMKTAASKYVGRQDLPQFDIAAIFEATVNAVAHRDYSIHGSKIRLRLFEDRLELYSPGALANSMTLESLPFIQSTRNEVLCSLLTKCALPDEPWLLTKRQTMIERRGEGVPIILNYSKRLSGKMPEYRMITQEELMLTIYAAGE